jgi:hypothetical protein
MKTHLIVKILAVTLFKLLVEAYRNPPMILETVPYKPETILKRVTVLLSYPCPANESPRRTSLHLSLSAKSTFYLPALTVGSFKGRIEAHKHFELPPVSLGSKGSSDAVSGKIFIISIGGRSSDEIIDFFKQ